MSGSDGIRQVLNVVPAKVGIIYYNHNAKYRIVPGSAVVKQFALGTAVVLGADL